jgi:hypothetical protein
VNLGLFLRRKCSIFLSNRFDFFHVIFLSDFAAAADCGVTRLFVKKEAQYCPKICPKLSLIK